MLRSPALRPTTATSSPAAIVRRPARNRHVLAVSAALGLLRAYKLLVSPYFAGSCRFEPSCSDYMAESIRVYGVMSGTWRGVKRLSRCRPLGGHGFDPVPRP
jgi:putative membrane protein insertion efficiency factor